jgi:hypothetical protein
MEQDMLYRSFRTLLAKEVFICEEGEIGFDTPLSDLNMETGDAVQITCLAHRQFGVEIKKDEVQIFSVVCGSSRYFDRMNQRLTSAGLELLETMFPWFDFSSLKRDPVLVKFRLMITVGFIKELVARRKQLQSAA